MKAEKKAALIADLTNAGRLDQRQLYVFNDAKSLPGGAFGLCIVSIAGDTLYISDTNLSSTMGELIGAYPFSQMENFKASTFPFNPYVKFGWCGQQIHLGGISKQMLAAISK